MTTKRLWGAMILLALLTWGIQNTIDDWAAHGALRWWATDLPTLILPVASFIRWWPWLNRSQAK